MTNYIEVLGNCFPSAQAYVTGGDPTMYENLTWITSPIDKATLDASPCALTPDAPVDVNSSNPDYPTYVSGADQKLYYGLIPFRAGTTSFTDANAAPPITEGSEIWSLTLTPLSKSSVFTLMSSLQADMSKSGNIVVALFRGSVCIGTTLHYCSGGDKPGSMSIQFIDTPNTQTEVTYSARIGTLNANGTWYINQSKSFTLGGRMQQHFIIMENI